MIVLGEWITNKIEKIINMKLIELKQNQILIELELAKMKGEGYRPFSFVENEMGALDKLISKLDMEDIE